MRGYGNIKVNGKLELALSCGCCVAVNERKAIAERTARVEILAFKKAGVDHEEQAKESGEPAARAA